MNYANRQSVERDYPNVKGTALSGNTLLVLVTRKYDESELEYNEIVPREVTIDGTTYQTDVVPVGIPHLRTADSDTAPENHQRRHDPIPGGVSIGNDAIGAGTMGSPLLEHSETGDPVVLTNAHVAGGADEQLHPSTIDGDAAPFGTLREASPLEPGTENTTDSALIDVSPEDIDGRILGLDTLAGFGEPEFGKEHTKAGRTSGVTTGELRGRDAEIDVAFGPDTLRFTGCDVFSYMSEPGDSGSLIGYLAGEGFHATDLLFAGSDQITIGIPLPAVEAYHGTLSVPDREADDGDEDENSDDSDTAPGGDESPTASWGAFRYQAQIDPSEVVDGDTFDVTALDLGFSIHRRGQRIRLLGIDTAEIHGVPHDSEEYRLGMEQKEFVEDWLQTAIDEHAGEWPVILETHKDETGSFGRYLADVTRKSDGEALSAALIAEYGESVRFDLAEQLRNFLR